jgi:hypothetical protein
MDLLESYKKDPILSTTVVLGSRRERNSSGGSLTGVAAMGIGQNNPIGGLSKIKSILMMSGLGALGGMGGGGGSDLVSEKGHR